MILDKLNANERGLLSVLAINISGISLYELPYMSKSRWDKPLFGKFLDKLKSLNAIDYLPNYEVALKSRYVVEVLEKISKDEFSEFSRIIDVYRSKDGPVKAFANSLFSFLHGHPFKASTLTSGSIYDEERVFLLLSYLLSNQKYEAFVSQIPENAKLHAFSFVTRDIRNLSDNVDMDFIRKQCVNSLFLEEEYRNLLQDELTLFDDFLHHGLINECVEKTHKDSFYGVFLNAILMQYRGLHIEAADVYIKLLRAYKMKHFQDVFMNFMYVLALMMSQDKNETARKKLVMLSKNSEINQNVDMLPVIVLLKIATEGKINYYVSLSDIKDSSRMVRMLTALVMKHYEVKCNANFLSKVATEVESSDYDFFKLEYSQDFENMMPKRKILEAQTGMKPLLSHYHKPAEWELVINELMTKMNVRLQKDNASPLIQTSRIVYLVSDLRVTPILQKSKDGVTWTKGRIISLSTFFDGIPEMSERDHEIAALIKYPGSFYAELSGNEVLAALVGYNNVYMAENPDLRIDIVEEKPQIQLASTAKGYQVKMNIKDTYISDGMVVVKETPQLYKIIKVTREQVDILDIIRKVEIFPKEAKDDLVKLLEALGKKVMVLSDLLESTENIKSVKGSTLTTVQMRPINEMISVQLFVKPLEKGSLYCTPGKGMEYIATSLDGEQVKVVRDLKAESLNYAIVHELMLDYNNDDADNRWTLDAEECLNLLDCVQDKTDICCVEWPEGVKYKVKYPMLNFGDFNISVNGIGQWFSIDGEVKIGDGIVVKMGELLKMLRASKGNFIRLKGDEYVALGEQIRKQLGNIEKLVQEDKNGIMLSQFNVDTIESLKKAGAKVQVDNAYKKLIKNIEDSGKKKFSIPKNIQADLRGYQKDGYVWMSQLAEWGAGACLADDMGLGKTLQAITVMLSKAKNGPSLVIMPTSVLLNWQEEIERFAPELNPVIMNQQGDNRRKMIDNAGKYDVVLTTYGLLINEEDALCSRKWNMIVLDEAHTIKNRETKMSKSAMKLTCDFRLMLTGTPLQNHLSEIWNLFQFADPGLLGSFQQFTDRFINPIEKNQDKERQKLLNRILSPFILRRTKSEVLSELPEKTEITLKVEMSSEEWALYEHIRQQALLNMEENQGGMIQALAEITRLRQAACHPALIDSKLPIPSSKSEAFLNLVDELTTNHHRALVFSQFTSHLALIRQELDERGIKYLYLDGATSTRERTRLVKEFQTGDMPLFLISLKAGGLGLNLTAADYVIHLDPWWNPAIEDQASDRAYRIGQKRSVTVYRLITKGTIEEKIIELHKTKKSLADAMLEGSDMTQKMSRDELLDMLKNGIS